MKKCITVIMLLLCLGYGYSEKYYRKNEITFEHDEDFWIGAGWKNVHSSLQLKSEKTKVCHYDNYYDYEKRKYTLYVEKGASLVRGSFVLKEDFIPGGGISLPFPQVSGTDDNTIFMNLTLNRLMDVVMYRINDLPEPPNQLYFVNSPTNVKLNLKGPESTREYTQIELDIIPDDDYPYIEINNKKLSTLYDGEIPDIIYFNKNSETINYEIKDDTSGIAVCKRITNDYILSIPGGFFTYGTALDLSELFGSSVFSYNGELIGDTTYKLIIEDLVGHRIKQTIVVDRTEPEIKVCTDFENKNEFSGSNWINQDLYITYKDGCSGIATINGVKHSDLEVYEESYTETGVYNLSATDKAGNTAVKTIKIDKILPEFETSLEYKSEFDTNQNNYKSKIILNINNIRDAHSGIAKVCVQPVRNGKTEAESIVYSSFEGKNNIDNQQYIYELTDRNKDNNVRFEVNVTDAAGNTEAVTLGANKGYFVPAGVSAKYKEEGNNSVRLDFFSGNKPYVNKNYSGIRVKRNFALPDKNSKDKGTDISKGNFDKSHITILKKLEEPVEVSKDDLKTDEKGVYYIDEGIKDTGFTHKFVTYDWISEYENPVDPGKKVTETIKGSEVLKLDNNTGIYYLKVKGDEGSYIILGDDGKIKEGSESAFKMPVTGIVGLEIKIEDEDTEPYRVEIQGKAEIPSENGKFKLRETDRDPVAAEGAIAGCCGTICDDGNRKTFISTSEKRPMNGDWVDMGSFNLQYNVTTVFSVELTEGFAGWQKTSKSENIRMYAKAPSVLGGKASLHVGDAGAYDADGISARPHQNFMLEIVLEDAGLNSEKFEWDFGNGLNQNNCSGKKDEKGLEIYKKISPFRFENVHYHQKEDRRGAISEYTLTIKCGEERAEFKVNIIDTQWGELLGDEVWRGDHIIKKEIIVPANTTLQIGDTVPKHSDYDSDITCLCVGKINPEDKGGITVEQGGTLKIDEGSAKHIKFIQGVLGTDSYEPATVKSFENRWKGIKVKGKLEGDRLDVADAEKALVIQGEGSAAFTRAIELNDCLEGILMNGAELKAEEIDISGSESSVSGIKTNKKIDCKTIKITGAGRGIILLSGGEFDIKTLEISGCKTGIHLLGGNLKIESGVISGCSEYGIKKDKGGSFDYGAFSFEGNERNIYENGIIR